LSQDVRNLAVSRPRGRPRSAPTVPRAMPRAVNGHASKYASALLHPFSPEAEGVRVPEPYAQPTVTYKLHRVMQVTTNAAGSFDFVITPSLTYGAIQFTGTQTGLTARTITGAPAGVVVYDYNPDLAGTLRSYRVVSYGLRIKSNTTFNNTKGRVYVARVPAAVDYPNQLATGASLTEFANGANIPLDGGSGVTSSIFALPKAAQFTLSELHQESGVELITHPIGPSAVDFLDGVRTTSEIMGGTAVVQHQVGYYSGRGWQQFLISGEGMDASSQLITLEFVAHVEGTPILANTGGSMIASGQVAAVGAPETVAKVHALVAQQPLAMKIRQKALTEMEHRAGSAISRFGRLALNKARAAAHDRGGLAADLLGVALV